MLKKLLLFTAVSLISVPFVFAQTSNISGTITDSETGEPVPQANIYIVELQRGDAANFDGYFEINNVEHGTYTFRITSVGYRPIQEEVTVNANNTSFEFELSPDLRLLDDVVVTAFGVQREERSLGYSIQEISGDVVSRTDRNNIVGALSGQVSGVQVVGSSGANIGGSERIRIRGANGLSDGQPLFVIDGTPMDNSSFLISGGGNARGRDLGNLMSDLNIQNVESISVLKGAAASALYGNRASNGVVLITTRSGQMGEAQRIQVDYSNSTYFENVSLLPDYQNEYAGGYNQNFIEYTDPVTGGTYNGLNYAADESWGPRMDGRMYRPWWSWFDHDFTGDGQSDYGREVALNPQPDNVREFFDTGVRLSNSLAITGGSENSSFRAALNHTTHNGVIPNSQIDRTAINFNGALSHTDRFNSRVAFNYVNTSGEGRPAQGYSPAQGNPMQSFNQWFQRQLNMDMLREYRTADGTPTSWNIRSNTDLRPLYWDSPFFSINENTSTDSRDRIFGNYSLSYNVLDNLELIGKLHLDTYSFTAEDRIASGGLEQDWFYIAQRTRREVNYEAGLQFEENYEDFSFNTYLGANIRQERYSSLIQQTAGGLSTPNFYNIDASIDRPNVSNFKSEKDVRSLYGNLTVGFRDLIYLEGSVRNDWSSALPANDNSYLYYSLSSSLVFTEFDVFANQDVLSFGKLRASLAQVGNDLDPYQIFQTFSTSTPYGNNPTQTVPNTLNNNQLRPAISTDYEVGIDLRFFNGNLRTDVNYFNSIREDEILSLQVPGAAGFSQAVVNAGKFTTTGWEVSLGSTVFQNQNWNVDLGLNWATSNAQVDELAEGITTRLLESGFFGAALYAEEGREWGNIVTTGGYGGFAIHEETGQRIVNDNGRYAIETNKDLGNILPDWTGGFRMDVNYRNFSLGTFFDYQKGGQFYSLTKMFNAYSGLGAETVGNNTLGNPLRNPVVNSAGEAVAFVPLNDAASNSGGVLVEGVNPDGNEVAYLYQASLHYPYMFNIKEEWIYDASYLKLREIKLTYNLPSEFLANLPLQRASVSLDIQNAFLLYSSVDGIDPSIIQNNANGFAFWEGGGLPPTRTIGFNINLSF
ncbi:SusC/RagA family TonB-linked outer membrane protein [Rhodohalobacter sp. SW132]|uniref:SusC/RagA family TonB-linked outer membrane protein n=1 Tax=Rhodohalobacter sp. SW132 TaxID=2293433 RepID=UPI000E23B375|nr:SusC/RagA family TonB-linked outer membrane protein [Rhodohalobacter sp. SW132]REL29117.1 SusC/RagA family TonB-linked outer membrane protein [Rhodohalobacter sp. SW132]